MENKKEKTAPDVSVGADTEQPIFKNTTSSISETTTLCAQTIGERKIKNKTIKLIFTMFLSNLGML